MELARLRNQILAGRGPIVVVGTAGTGKTDLCRALQPALAGLAYTARISGPVASESALVERILNGFGVAAPAVAPADAEGGLSRWPLLQVLRRFIAGLSSVGARAVVIVDDAHALDRGVFAAIADLASLETGGRPMLQFVLVGRPELRDILEAPAQAALGRLGSVHFEIQAAPSAFEPVPEAVPRRGASLAVPVMVALLGSAVGVGLTALVYAGLGF